MSRSFIVACLALATGAAAYAVALVWLPSSYFDGHYVPVGMDSFYHARRILDAVADPGAFYQFDPFIHAPEGSWITWPWAYDLGLAWLALGIMALTGATDPMAILAYVPPSWAFVNAALLLALGAALGLRPLALAAVGALYALSPLTQMLHGVGVLDHHYVEYSFVLAAALAGVRWLQQPEDRGRAAMLGAVLGIAPAFHNGLFALQLPLDATLFLLWLRGAPLPRRSVAAYAAALGLATLVAVLPSEPFREGQFSFATLSWFHVYVAALSAAGALGLSWLPRSWRAAAVLAGGGAAALWPIAADVVTGSQFLSATLVKLDEMGEAIDLPELYARGGLYEVARTYTGLIVLLPLIGIAAVAGIARSGVTPAWRYAAVFALFGAGLLCFQARLHYYGSAVLFLAPLLALQHLAGAAGGNRRAALAGLGVLALAAAHQPTFRELWIPVPVAWSFDSTYAVLEQGLYPRLRQACAERPGIVLATNEDGHHIRYNTDCSVISNNFILTPQHERKLLETEHLLTLPAQAIVDARPDVDYIFVRRADPVLEGWTAAEVAAANAGLRAELLFGDRYPAALKPIGILTVRTGADEAVVLAKAFRIERPPGRGAAAGPPAARRGGRG